MPTYLNPTYRLTTTIIGSTETSLDSITSDVDGNIYTVGKFGSTGAVINIPSGISPFDIPPDMASRGLFMKSNKNGTTIFRTFFESNTSARVLTDSFSNSYISGDGFVTRFTDSGVPVWTTNVSVSDISIDLQSNVYICGQDGITKLDSDGNIVYTNTLQELKAVSISVDQESNVYVACTGSSDACLVKYTEDGSQAWKGSIDGNVYATSSHVSSSHAYISGTSPGFVVQYTLDGEINMSIHVDGTCIDVATDATNIFVCGSYGPNISNVYVSAECKTQLPQTNLGFIGGYIVRFDTDGNVIWQVTVSGESDVTINSLTIDQYQNSYITGVYGPGSAVLYDTLASYTTLPNCTCASGFSIKLDSNGRITFLHSI
jgi:hypothetical protein